MKNLFGSKCLSSFAVMIFLLLFTGQSITTSYSIAGELRVYDANDQDLGIYAGISNQISRGFLIFLPGLQRFISLYGLGGNIGADRKIDCLFFESTNCTGTPYVQSTNFPTQEIFYNAYHDNYVILDFSPVVINYRSYTTNGNTECSTINDSNTLYEAVEFLINELPFDYPAQPPLRIEYYTGIPGDIDGDSDVDGNDLASFSDNYGTR